MALTHVHKTLIILLAYLTFWAGSSSLAHATEYGHAPHEHDGVVCIIYGAQEHTATIVPDSAPIFAPITQVITPDYIPYISAKITNTQNRGPPPRGPPA